MTLRQKLFTVRVFVKLSTKRFFRDRLALFFGILFPLIFLFVFGSMSKGGSASFNVTVFNESKTDFAQTLTKDFSKQKFIKLQQVNDMNIAKDKMSRGELDSIIVLREDFGKPDAKGRPSGNVLVYYQQGNPDTGQTFAGLIQGMLSGYNYHLVHDLTPLGITTQATEERGLSRFDYAFAGLLGFSIIGIGIFGPMNVFPELKKQGILRRLHTTPIRVWQYFLSTMIAQAIIGLISLAVMFVFAIALFDLHVTGNYLEIALFCVFGIFLILGIGLSIGGWASNERQAAPLGNIVVFPMMFLSGTFFPRYAMPEWLQGVSGFLPLTPVIDGLRFLTTEGKHLVDIGAQLGYMAVWMIIIYAIAFRVFRWE